MLHPPRLTTTSQQPHGAGRPASALALVLAAAGALMLAACGAPGDDVAAEPAPASIAGAADPADSFTPPPPLETQTFSIPAGTRDRPREISWDELMPIGEEDILAEMYEAFYADLDRQLRGSQTQMTAPGAAWSPEATPDGFEEGGEFDKMPQLGTFNTVAELDGQHVRIPAYITPLDFSASTEHAQFLLVPYFGACIHSPPPPPNQVIFVQASPPARIANIWGAVWAEGLLTAQTAKNDIGDAAYTLQLTKLEPYDG